MKLLIFIVNPKAGNGRGKKVWHRIKTALEEKKINYRSFHTEYQGHGEILARQICSLYKEKIKTIVAVGGDGTVHEVINGIVQFPYVNVGYIPAGSGNDFARGFNVPTSPLEALSTIIKQQSGKRFDIGKFTVNGAQHQYFVSSLGTGFDAAVAKKTNEAKMKKWFNKLGLGSISYIVAVLQLLFTYKLTNILMTVDGVTYRYENVWFVTISNQPYYGGGMKIAPQASTTDGLFDITVVHNLSKLKLLIMFGTVFFGKHTGMKEVSQLKGRSISVESKNTMYVHADGEIIGQNPIHAEIQPQKLSVLAK